MTIKQQTRATFLSKTVTPTAFSIPQRVNMQSMCMMETEKLLDFLHYFTNLSRIFLYYTFIFFLTGLRIGCELYKGDKNLDVKSDFTTIN